jgi:hypothetical protein
MKLVTVPQPHCHQIIGIPGAVSGSRDSRNGTFHQYLLFLLEAVGTENVSFPKPANVALRPVDRSRRLSKQLFAIHPLAQFLSSVPVNKSDLILTTVVVRHSLSP